MASQRCTDRITTRYRHLAPPDLAQQSAPAASTAGALCQKSADFGDQLAHRVTHVVSHFGVIARVLTVQRLERNRQLDAVAHPSTGNRETLAGIVVRPHPAVLTEGPA